MANTETPSKRRSVSRYIVVLLVLATGGALGGYFLLTHGKVRNTAESPKTQITSVLHLEPFTVNMNDPDQVTFLRLGIDLGLSRELMAEKGPGLTPTALIRDTILTVLMSTRPEDILQPEGKQRLKERLLASLNQRAPELSVREIYFTEFLLQR